MIGAVPMAQGARSPVWPLPAVTRRRWTFGASRANGKRHHAGVDLYAPRGSVVLSPESGTIIAFQPFNGPHAVAMLIQTDTGPVILLGEIEPSSWTEFGLGRGSRVEAGQEVARLGINPGGSQMLHYEMYREGTTRNARWYTGKPPPSNLLNPTEYLQRARALDVGQQNDDVADDDGQVEDPGVEDHDHDHDHDDPGDTTPQLPDIKPDIHPQIPQVDSTWHGLGRLALVFGVLYFLSEWDR